MRNIGTVDLKKFSFHDPITRYGVEDYYRVRDAYIKQIAGQSDLSAVYQMGGITDPGISDLDLIVVLREKLKSSKASDYSVRALGDQGRYFFMHDPIFVSDHVVRDLNLLMYATNLKLLHGSEIPQAQLTPVEERHVKLAILIDHSLQILHKLAKPLVCRFVYVRSVLPILYSIRYSIRLAEDLQIAPANFWTQFVQEIITLRQEWLSNRNYEKLVYLIIEGLYVVADLMQKVSDYVDKSGVIAWRGQSPTAVTYVRNDYNSATLFLRDPTAFYRPNSIDHLGVRPVSLKVGRRLVWYSTVAAVHPLFRHHFLAYGGGSGTYSATIRKLFTRKSVDQVSVNASYQGTMVRRADAYDTYRQFTRNNGFSAGIVFFASQKVDTVGEMGVLRAASWSAMSLLNRIVLGMSIKGLGKYSFVYSKVP